MHHPYWHEIKVWVTPDVSRAIEDKPDAKFFKITLFIDGQLVQTVPLPFIDATMIPNYGGRVTGAHAGILDLGEPIKGGIVYNGPLVFTQYAEKKTQLFIYLSLFD